ncbi:MAG TPA: phosphonate C-P lyase system protein PhnH [Xanthobacteraceae bacterium]|jgi:alpha-D-ribose 1-methylphosphonate 5-triphosphate synthase subunit PhnH
MVEQGFATPVFDAQRIFRALLSALAEPGRILPVEPGCVPPHSLDPVAAAIVLTLCDADTPLWLAPGLASTAAYIRLHTGAPIVASPKQALFALAGAQQRPPLDTLHPGAAEYPDRAATLILIVDGLDDRGGWSLAGPGIRGRRTFLPRGIDAAFATEWRASGASFPLGVDVLFAARDRVAGLPRSTTMEG